MMKTSSKQVWTLGAVMIVGGCQLGVEQLEVGDSLDDTDESGEAPTEGESDTDEQDADLCVTQGTNLDGGSEPLDFQLPACEVECATGWGHGAPPLANAWTLDLEHDGPSTGFTHLGLLPSGNVVAMTSQTDAPTRLVLISPDGALLDDIAQPDITGDVHDMGVDQDGTIYALWQSGNSMALSAMTSDGELAWTVGLGTYLHGVLAPLDQGVMMALNPADPLDPSYLVHVNPGGGIMQVGPIPVTWEIAVTPSGNTVATANFTTITWTDFSPFPTETRTRAVADVSFVFGLVALDDERVASVGVAKNWDEDGLTHGYLNQIGPMGLDWSARYDRALSWCPAALATDEAFLDVVGLADGSLLVIGSEGAGVLDGQFGDEQLQQPWVGHVSAQGDVLGTDRGFWRGRAVAAAGAEDGSAYVLLHGFDEANQQQFYVRKYLP